jgi:hypothetical protein
MKPSLKLTLLANKIEAKLNKLAASAQRGDIENALKNAHYFDFNDVQGDLNPLLDKAKVPNEAKLDIKIKVIPGPAVDFLITPAIPALLGLMRKFMAPKIAKILSTATMDVGVDPKDPAQLKRLRVPLQIVAPLDPINWITLGAN